MLLDTPPRLNDYPPSQWSAAVDVGEWLRRLGLGRYEENFRENNVAVDVPPCCRS
jgi:hypothetical protein